MTEQEMRDALVRLDALSLELGQTLRYTRVGWDEDANCDSILRPFNEIAQRIGEVIPEAIKATRPTYAQRQLEKAYEYYLTNRSAKGRRLFLEQNGGQL